MPDSTTIKDFLADLPDHFPEDRLTYQKGYPTFHPESAAEAATVIRLAGEAGQKLFITGYGNNIDPVGEIFEELLTIRDDRLNDLLEIDEKALAITAGSGFPLREINAKLAKHDLFFPLSNLPYVGSVGGAIAVGLGASLDPKHWQKKLVAGKKHPAEIYISRFILRLEIALPTGQVRSFGVGSDKVLSGENFARIFSPSWGLYGFIASAKLRVLPQSAQEEYRSLTQKPISQAEFLETLACGPQAPSYAAEVRAKFDPQSLFPIIHA